MFAAPENNHQKCVGKRQANYDTWRCFVRFLYVCESWTLTAELQRKIQVIEMRCYRKILHISYQDHVTNKEVRAKIQQAIGPHEDLLLLSRSSGLAKTILQGTVKG